MKNEAKARRTSLDRMGDAVQQISVGHENKINMLNIELECVR